MRFLTIIMVVLLLFQANSTHAQTDNAADPQTVDGVAGVMAAFEEYSIVAIGEQHGIAELGAFYQSILQHPDFASTVDAVVMEYGNALYQDVADAYVNGEDVPYSELQKIWSDAVGRVPGGTEIMYGQVFATLRAINQDLPESERVRVLLGDPPIDWSQVESIQDVLPFQMQRESHFAEVVMREVLEPGHKALVITGGPHLSRDIPTMQSMPMPSDGTPVPDMIAPPMLMQQIVEAQYPGQTFVIIVHTGFVEDDCNAEIEARMADWAAPTLAMVEGSWLAAIPCTKFPAAIMVATDTVMTNPQGSAAPPNMPPAPASSGFEPQIAGADAYLFVGFRDDLTMSPFDPIIYQDLAFFAEQSRRHQIIFGQPLDWAAMVEGNPKRYVDNF